jgi:CO/xanthine dehydrogenase FAD-binding subunit
MHQIVGYHRPVTISDAVALLDDDLRLPIGGGTSIRHDGGGPPVEVVDLQALGLGAIVAEGDRVRLGATATLQQLTDANAVPDLVRRVAKAEQPSAMRTITTVGGTIGAADPESVLLAVFVVHDALVRFADGRDVELSTVLDGGMLRGDLIVSVSLVAAGRGSLASTARTPADTPIVAAVGRVVDGGTVVALTGVGPVPRVYERRELEHLEPPSDFRGTSAYRRHLAAVLSARVVAELS